MRIMSFNIRCAEFTPERIELVIKSVEKYAPDTVGFQEVTDGWYAVLKERLGEVYASVGCGRDADRCGEASPVFYRKSKYNCIESATYWMCDTPEIPGSKVESSTLPRIFTHTLLRDIESGKEIAHINTHLEHKSETARLEQTDVIFDHLKRLEKRNIPYVLTGDFNSKEDSECYQKLLSFGLLDSSKIAKSAEVGATFHGYGRVSGVIDYIFLHASVSAPECYKVCTDTETNPDGTVAYPSDHNPIFIDVNY